VVDERIRNSIKIIACPPHCIAAKPLVFFETVDINEDGKSLFYRSARFGLAFLKILYIIIGWANGFVIQWCYSAGV
jgi:hypothetical protein